MKKKCNTIIISYPRSGLNWIRWNVEYFTGRPTPGCTRIVENKINKNYVFHRTHDVKRKKPYNWSCHRKFYSKKLKPLYKNVILLLRNPYELYGRRKKTKEKVVPQGLRAYKDNLITFDKFKGNKLLVYYEDLIKNYEREMKRICDFLEIKVNLNKINVKQLKRKSLESYTNKGSKKARQKQLSDAKSTIYHTKNLTPKEKRELTIYLKKTITRDIRKKYLKKYNKRLV